jgi:hypothetical protein
MLASTGGPDRRREYGDESRHRSGDSHYLELAGGYEDAVSLALSALNLHL